MTAFSQLGLTFAQGTHQNHFLFADHYLNALLTKEAVWEAGRGETAVFSHWLQALYQQERDNLPGYNEAQLEDHWIRPILHKLGWEGTAETQAVIPALAEANIRKPDYVFFPSVAARQAAAGRQNSPTYAQEAVAVGEAKRWTAALDKKVRGGEPNFDNNNPSYQIDYYLRATGVTWGVLTNGRLWRLVHKESSYKLDVYFEIDLETAVQNNSLAALRYFTLFFGRSSFLADENGRVFLNEALTASVRYARELETDLRDNAYKALEQLITGFFALPRNQLDPANPAHLQQVYTNSLYLLYRLLFLLYGESRGLLPLGNDQYKRHSLTALVEATDPALGKQTPWNPYTRQVWIRLSDLFHLINGTNPKMNQLMGVPRYNGGLFNPVLHPFLEKKAIGDSYLVQAIDYLARRDSHKQGDHAVKEPVDYRTLGVRQLGSIYEGLLEYAPRAATEPMVTVRRQGVEVWVAAHERGKAKALEQRQVGELYLATDKGERKATGSYYTPDYIVKYMVEQTLNPLIEQARQRVKAGVGAVGAGLRPAPTTPAPTPAPTDQAQRFIEEVLALKVLDPAMGSGHFLVEATDHLARALATDEWVQGESGSGDVEADLVYWRRRVVEACIYGVDKNPMAVELAKLSLWLVTVAKERPLSFLDHHLRHGDSLVGARLADLGALPSGKKGAVSEQQLVLLNETALAQDLFRAVGGMDRIGTMLSETLEDVYAKERILAELRRQLDGWRTLANVWTSSFFGNGMSPEEYREVARHVQGEATSLTAAQLTPFLQHPAVTDNDYFHWELAFPEIFFDMHGQPLGDRAGFDAVIGNPPWLKVAADEAAKLHLELRFEEISFGEMNFYTLFLNLVTSLVRVYGEIGQLVPNTWMINLSNEKLRRYLLEHLGMRFLFTLCKNIFPDAPDTIPVMIIATKGRKDGKCKVFVADDELLLSDRFLTRPLWQDTANPDTWRLRPYFQISPYDTDRYKSIFLKMETSGTPLGEFCHASDGIYKSTVEKFRTIYQVNPDDKEIVESAAQTGRYWVNWQGSFIPKALWQLHRDLHSGVKFITHAARKPKIQRQLVFAYEEREIYFSNRFILVKQKSREEDATPKALLAILNSRLMNHYYRFRFPITDIDAYMLHQLPIYLFSKPQPDNVQQTLGYLAHEMLESQQAILKIEQRFWLDLEGVTGDELAKLQKGKWEERLHKEVEAAQSFVHADSRSTRTLEESLGWNEAAFRGFVRLLLGKVKGLADMVEVYNRYHPDYAALVRRIAETDALIDQIVYKLYGLTDEEIAIVEGAS